MHSMTDMNSRALLSIPPDQVHLWVVFDGDVPHGLLAEYRKLLTDEERSQEERFHFPRHRRQYLITRALVRTVLSRYSRKPPAQWRFIQNAHGRPSLRDEEGRAASSLSFNLSHTDGLVVCGVAPELALGVDAECTRREASLDMADRFFSPQEAAALRSLPQGRQHRQFFDFWTLKESYTKAKGIGLSIPLDSFAFNSADAGSIVISFDASSDDSPGGWRFWSLQPSAEHIVAVCAQRAEGVSQQLVLRKTIPLGDEQPFSCAVLRRSG